MIKSFADKNTQKLFLDIGVAKFRNIERAARRKLMILNAALSLEDLKSPPGNNLESLKGDRIGQMSMRINKQWRLCFKWHENNAYEVEIVDYH